MSRRLYDLDETIIRHFWYYPIMADDLSTGISVGMCVDVCLARYLRCLPRSAKQDGRLLFVAQNLPICPFPVHDAQLSIQFCASWQRRAADGARFMHMRRFRYRYSEYASSSNWDLLADSVRGHFLSDFCFLVGDTDCLNHLLQIQDKWFYPQ